MKNKFFIAVAMMACALPLVSCGNSNGKQYYETAIKHVKNDLLERSKSWDFQYSNAEVCEQTFQSGNKTIAVKFDYIIKYEDISFDSKKEFEGTCYFIMSDYDKTTKTFDSVKCSQCSYYLTNGDDGLRYTYASTKSHGKVIYTQD